MHKSRSILFSVCQRTLGIPDHVGDDVLFRHARLDRTSLLLQSLGRVGTGGAEGLPG